MAQTATEAYWLDYFRKSDAQKFTKLHQKIAMHQLAVRIEKKYRSEREILLGHVQKCDSEIKHLIEPIMKYPAVHTILYNFLKECEERNLCFNVEIRKSMSLIKELEAFQKDIADNTNMEILDEKWEKICLNSKEKLDEESENRKKEKTYLDMPKDELAERLSKGEIIPRNEWIPGISTGKRKLDYATLEQHLSFGEEIRNAGKVAYQNKNYELAFTRFSQGVQLLCWVEGKSEEGNEKLQELYKIHLNNQAQSAIKISKYQDAIKASTTIIQEFDEFDNKARYRRGKAYLYLGLIKAAKDDFLFILRSPYANQESRKAASLGLKEIRNVLFKASETQKKLFSESTKNHLFSSNRYLDEKRIDFNTVAKSITEIDTPPISRGKEEQSDLEDNIRLGLDETIKMLEEILQLYTSDEIEKQLHELRRLSDFEERRFVIRLQKILPLILKPILDKYGFTNHSDFQANRRDMEKVASYWSKKDEEVKQLYTECWNAIYDNIWNL